MLSPPSLASINMLHVVSRARVIVIDILNVTLALSCSQNLVAFAEAHE